MVVLHEGMPVAAGWRIAASGLGLQETSLANFPSPVKFPLEDYSTQ